MPFYQVGDAGVDVVILGRAYVYPPGSVLWFPERLPLPLVGLAGRVEVPPFAPVPPARAGRPDPAVPPIPNLETKSP